MTDTTGDLLSLMIFVAVVVVIALLVGRPLLKAYKDAWVTIYDYESGLKYVRGKIVAVLPPGRYNTFGGETIVERHDMREQGMTVAGQEILTKDNMPVRVSVIVNWKIADVTVYKRTVNNVSTRLHEATQVVLRRRVAALDLDAILADRAAIDAGAAAEVQAAVGAIGVTIVGVDLRDVTLMGVAKQAYADLWRAQKEGLAALERARGEQAALRSLANAARMLKGNPELMNLRVLQALQGQQGKASPTVILGGAPGLVPVSKDAAPPESAE
ncbi:MAG: slipin family protein [Hyphomonadaceae bacterium]|nr:slipin family protein [Hyphomonadaceae bacterium]